MVTCKGTDAGRRSQDEEWLETKCHGLNVVPKLIGCNLISTVMASGSGDLSGD